jgi:hypothetical protein
VTGTFNVPIPKVGNDGTQYYYDAEVWVGIDGGPQCGSPIWQIGLSALYDEQYDYVEYTGQWPFLLVDVSSTDSGISMVRVAPSVSTVHL